MNGLATSLNQAGNVPGARKWWEKARDLGASHGHTHHITFTVPTTGEAPLPHAGSPSPSRYTDRASRLPPNWSSSPAPSRGQGTKLGVGEPLVHTSLLHPRRDLLSLSRAPHARKQRRAHRQQQPLLASGESFSLKGNGLVNGFPALFKFS